ncbi:MAG: TetR/AcrR family transcriptional regulator [Myxococcota bacterium]|nr:TetR/AcrR family transcriptional regulator [Myxococcota bacterium]
MSVTDMDVTTPQMAPTLGARPRSAGGRSRQATRERLLAAGRVLFARDGVHGVTSHDIARHAGVAAGTFYLHFADKREMFREIALEAVAALREQLAASTRNAPDVATGVRAHAEALIAFAEKNREFVRILFSPDADAAAVESVVLDTLASVIAARRRERIAAGELTPDVDPDVLSQALVGMLARVIAWWVEDPQRASRDAVIETLTRIQLAGTYPG